MLLQLKIENFAIIDNLLIKFNQGMSVITGETGTGKSIIVNALEQLVKQRSSSSLIGVNKDYAYIEALFNVTKYQNHPIIKELKIDCSKNLIVSKQIDISGKTIVKINDEVKSFTALKRLMSILINLHSQFDTLEILNEYSGHRYIDHIAQIESFDSFIKYQQLFEEYLEAKKTLQDLLLLQNQSDYIEHIDLQIKQLKEFQFTKNEIDEMILEKQKLDRFEQSYEIISDTLNQFEKKSVLSILVLSEKKLSKIDHPLVVSINELYYSFEEFINQLKSCLENDSYDKKRYSCLVETLFEIKRLQKKFGNDLNAVYEALIEQKSKIENIEILIDSTQSRIVNLQDQMNNLLLLIHEKRQLVALELERDLTYIFRSLALQDAVLKVEFVEHNDYTFFGKLRARFLVQMNQGYPFLLLNQVASGGELSRIILALKVQLSNIEDYCIYVFDEIDSGVSGRIAKLMADQMKKISENYQVLTITHLAQVACLADNHYQVCKSSDGKSIFSDLSFLNEHQHVEAIAQMLSGSNVTKAAILQAKELIYEK